MFKKLSYFLIALVFAPVALGWVILPVRASMEIGKPAPDFKAVDVRGKEFKLSEQTGKIVVLEWSNHECPFVKKHYGTGNMQAVQKKATDSGVVWVSIVSSAPGKQGHVTPEDALKIMKDTGSNETTRILDESGDIGKLYAAKTTPHMFIVNTDGNLVYEGAIDDNSNPDPAAIEGANNFVTAALDELATGKPVSIPTTIPYGCSVKY